MVAFDVVRAIPIKDLEQGGANAPINQFDELDAIPIHSASRLRRTLPGGAPLDALVVNRGTSAVVVALHGATDRSRTVLPRFEWLRSLVAHDVSSIFFADPALHLSPRLALAWYTGWADVDVHDEVARWSLKIAETLRASRIIFMGASGGGFAALQASSLLPGSEALAFNAQTDIARYRVNGEFWGAQRDYITAVWPSVWSSLSTPESFKDGRWADLTGDRVSAVRRYATDRRNLVHLVQNEEEFHYHEHFLPFLTAARRAGNQINEHTNREGTLHNPPRAVTFERHLRAVLAS